MSRITIEVIADDAPRQLQLCNQLRKLLPVHSVKELTAGSLHPARAGAHQGGCRLPLMCAIEIIQIANIFRASIIDVSPRAA